MKIIVLSLVTLLSASAFGGESHYLVNQQSIRNGALELNFQKHQEDLMERGQYNKSGTVMRLNYSQPLGELTSIDVGAQFMSLETSSVDNGQSHNVTGFGDFNLGLKSGIVFDSMTLVYGANASLSPGPAQAPYTRTDSSKTSGNNFSGIQTASPFIGAESYVNQIAIGGRLIANIFSAQRVQDSGDGNIQGSDGTQSFHFEGFAEFPVFRKLDVGILVGLGGSDGNVFGYFVNGSESLAQVYSQYKFDKDTTALVSLTSQTAKIPFEKNSTDFGIGLRKSL